MAKIIPLVFLSALFSSGFAGPAMADTVYLKNGRSMEGIIVKESSDNVELDVGMGKVIFSISEISRIQRSLPEEVSDLRKKFKEDSQRQATSREATVKKDDLPGSVNLVEQNGHVFVESVLNGRVRARLILDTGATFIVLPYRLAQELRIDPQKATRSAQLQLADGRIINTAFVTLDSVRAGHAEANNIEAAILPPQIGDIGVEDGILGMSFLKRFSFKVDYIRRKLILERGPTD
jgi:clan AA aspartic protease (TIGR02281 family)